MKIFMLHKWRHFYVKHALKELLKHNSPKDIVFFTDDKELSKDFFWFDIKYENISDYFISSDEFKDIYVHKSKNPYEYELICIQRWLIIFEYMEKHNIENCWHIDSDVLVLCNLETYANKYLRDRDFCCVASCWSTFYWNKKWLREFKNFLFDVYKNKLDVLDWFYKKEWYPIYPRNNWFIEHEKTRCVSDMTLFYLFIKEGIKWVKYKDIWMIVDNTVFDDNINCWVWFKHGKCWKSIKLINDKYYWSLEWKKTKILFNCLHFQWRVKDLIKFFEERNLWIKYYICKYWTYIIIPFCGKVLRVLKIDENFKKMYQEIIKR